MKQLFPRLMILLLLLTSGAAHAQSKKGRSSGSAGAGYNTGLGLRAGGYSSGLTFKHFISGKNGVAFEGLVTTEYKAHGARVTLLLEKHLPVADVKNLQFYYGAGGHVGSYRGRYYYVGRWETRGKHKDVYYTYYEDDTNYIAFGADLILGLEYKLPDLPFVVGVDYKPFFEVFDGYSGFYNDAALSLRFTF
ncbi:MULTISPECIES: hypothetical protein [Hymenobacter]|uniref:Outer membrane protein beta-barrel domain-containing protein n=1 Tax=Hymenobacter jejuensis TaxID=2502781 RepID=A0A5B7ZY83_9BACT|nr:MULTISPECIES: hypothetical protein [Hymenobacter]MBC6988164.1 hypothetical protein [Hymenobacter sp. BT491]QDA59466.1 hypothetical protein FHG12_04805 [Hymenobacter jejuensis]